VPYTVYRRRSAERRSIAEQLVAQAKLKFLPYHDAAEAIAEKFHSDVHFLEQLNPGKMKTLKTGDQLMGAKCRTFRPRVGERNQAR